MPIPASSNILFPPNLDNFPTLYDITDVASVSQQAAYHIAWAEAYDMLNNFIKAVEPMVYNESNNPSAAPIDATLNFLTPPFHFPPVSLYTLWQTFMDPSGNFGGPIPYIKPGYVIPYQFVFTTSDTICQYSKWPTLSSTQAGLMIQSRAWLQGLWGGYDLATIRPMIDVSFCFPNGMDSVSTTVISGNGSSKTTDTGTYGGTHVPWIISTPTVVVDNSTLIVNGHLMYVVDSNTARTTNTFAGDFTWLDGLSLADVYLTCAVMGIK